MVVAVALMLPVPGRLVLLAVATRPRRDVGLGAEDVRDDHQMAAGGDPPAGPTQDLQTRQLGAGVQEGGGHQVEVLLGRPFRQVTLHPSGALGEPALDSRVGGPTQRRRGDVETGGLPAAVGQPQHITALPAAQVQAGARGEGKLLNGIGQGGVHLPRPAGSLRVLVLPVGCNIIHAASLWGPPNRTVAKRRGMLDDG